MEDPAGLISVLLSPLARVDERDDAAMDLANSDSEDAERALALVACDPQMPEIVRASCGESLAEIWLRRGKMNLPIFAQLFGIAKDEATARFNQKNLSYLP